MVMPTPDQIRLRLEQVRDEPSMLGSWRMLLALLDDVLPELVARPALPVSREDLRAAHDAVWDGEPCPDCTPEQPCERVRELTGG